MSDFLEAIRLGAIWFANGLLVSAFVLADHWLFLAVLPPLAWLCLTCPLEQRVMVLSVSALTMTAGLFTPPPVPVIVLAMAWTGAFAVRFDCFNPNTLRVRVIGGLGLESLAALAMAGAWAYLNTLTPAEFGSLFAPNEVGELLAQGRGFLNTLGVLGTWFAIPLGYFSLLVQGSFLHAPLPATPAQLIHRIRSREQE